MLGLSSILAVATTLGLGRAHTVITYPGWRGNNLHANGTDPSYNPDSLGIDTLPNGTVVFPWGMQWMYPCGGMPQSNNRSKWPVDGGALSVQPGWFPGHSKALFYVNIGIQEAGQLAPPNMSHVVVPPFQITGPTNIEYDGQFCLPQVGMPANLSLQVGQNITLQVIEVAQHGASLYSCVDLTLVDDHDPDLVEVNSTNCYNSSDIGFNLLFTTGSLSATGNTSGSSLTSAPTLWGILAITLVMTLGTLL